MAIITVTAAQSGTTYDGVLLCVKVLTGISGSPIGNTATQSSTSSAAHEASIVTTATGSQVYGALAAASSSAVTGDANSTVLASQTDGPNGLDTGACRSTSATGTPGAATFGFSSPSGAGGLALLEILPAGTITEDPSSPAAAHSGSGASAVTTASLAPPANSLLVAMVGSDSNTGMVLAVTDSSGLTWTQRVVAQQPGALYAGVWTARVPATARSGLLVAAFP